MELEQLGEFAQGVLGLGHGQAVARHKHHPFGRFQGQGAFLGAATGDPGVAGLIAAPTNGSYAA